MEIVLTVLVLLLCIGHGLLWLEVRKVAEMRRTETEMPDRVQRFLKSSRGRELLRARLRARGIEV